jgi:hypothetical protein
MPAGLTPFSARVFRFFVDHRWVSVGKRRGCVRVLPRVPRHVNSTSVS